MLASSMTSMPMAMGALGTGLLFGNLVIAAARNPDEGEKLFGTCMTAFALIESFSFLSCITISIFSIVF